MSVVVLTCHAEDGKPCTPAIEIDDRMEGYKAFEGSVMVYATRYNTYVFPKENWEEKRQELLELLLSLDYKVVVARCQKNVKFWQ